MRTEPAKKIRPPKYPTRLEVLASPGLLQKHMPVAWKRIAETSGAVGILLAINSCVLAERTGRAPGQKAAVVAPIFYHGEGRGATGCLVVSPPVFLSEQDAMQVIREEMKKTGIDLSQEDVSVQNLKIEQVEERYSFQGPRKVVSGTTALQLTAWDPKKKVAIEYVAEERYFALGGIKSGSSVQSWDFKEVAGSVSTLVERRGQNMYFGAFYDPAPRMSTQELQEFNRHISDLYQQERAGQDKDRIGREIEKAYTDVEAKSRTEAKRLLRLQVQDFIQWLKAQGAI